LRVEGLTTGSSRHVCRTTDDTIFEAIEWASAGTDRPHTNAAVLLFCELDASACDYVPLALLAESSTLSAFFTPSIFSERVFEQKIPHGTLKGNL
jgi:hypothetical protein